VIASRVYHRLKPFYWLRSARATEHFTGSGLVETDRLTEKAEKAREGTNCIISTKAMSTVEAVDIDIDVRPSCALVVTTFSDVSQPSNSLDLSPSLQSAFQFVSEISLKNIIEQRHSPSLILGVGLRCSGHLIMAPTSSVAASTVVFSVRQPHWNIGKQLSTIYVPRANKHREHRVQPSGQPRRYQRSETRKHGFSLLLECESKNQRYYDATLSIRISPEGNLSGEFHDSHAERSISWGSTSQISGNAHSNHGRTN
jgi:hypothetical protein